MNANKFSWFCTLLVLAVLLYCVNTWLVPGLINTWLALIGL